jgi:hypothetical protein
MVQKGTSGHLLARKYPRDFCFFNENITNDTNCTVHYVNIGFMTAVHQLRGSDVSSKGWKG